MATKIWLDCDPGRDDAIAILLALHRPELELIGLSSVHGNSGIENMTANTARLLCSFGNPEQIERIPIAEGAGTPLIDHVEIVASVHGADGLGGVEGILSAKDPVVAKKIAQAKKLGAVEAMESALRNLPAGEQLTLVATGAYTNVALLLATYGALVKEKVSSIVVMGGAEGRGNKSPVAEANVRSDPHAAAILFNFDIKIVLCPLNLTHTALFTRDIHSLLLDPNPSKPYSPDDPLPKAKTTLRLACSTDFQYYAAAYRSKYGMLAPPCHDALTIAFVSHPHLFEGKRYRVDVELTGTHSLGATVVDLWEYKKDEVDQDEKNWGRTGKNVFVLEKVDVAGFWRGVFLPAVAEGDKVCVINKKP